MQNRDIVRQFAKDEGLDEQETIVLWTSVDAMTIDVADLTTVPGFSGLLVSFRSGRSFWILPGPVIIKATLSPVDVPKARQTRS